MNSESLSRYDARLSKVEASVDAIVRDLTTLGGNVRELASIVRTQGEQTGEQLKSLLVGVATATGPRKTDWQLVISAVALILALGAAIFTPLNMRIADLKEQAEKASDRAEAHMSLPLHPVAAVRLDSLEKELKDKETRNAIAIVAVDLKLQQEYRLISDKLCAAIEALDTRLQCEISVVEKKVDAAIEYQNESRERNTRQDEQLRELMKGKVE